MPNRLGEGRDLPGGQIAGQDGKCTSCNGVTAQPGHQPPAPGRPHQHRRCQPPPRPRSAADAKATSDRMNDFAGSLPQDLTEFSAVIEVPVGAVELDYLIADPALRGRGLGSRMIAAAVEDTWNSYSDAPAVLVAVVAANVASWRALEKAGLKRVAEGPMSPDNPIDDALHYIYRVDRPGAASSAF